MGDFDGHAKSGRRISFYEYMRLLDKPNREKLAETGDLDDPRVRVRLSEDVTYMFWPMVEWMFENRVGGLEHLVYCHLWGIASRDPSWTAKTSVWALARKLRRSDGRMRQVLRNLQCKWKLVSMKEKNRYLLHLPLEVRLKASATEREWLPPIHDDFT